MASSKSSKSSSAPKDVMGFLNYYLVDKAPFQLPEGLKKWIVKYLPWINLVLLVLFLPALLFIFGLSLALLPASTVDGVRATTGFGLATLALVVQVGLMIAALPGLFGRRRIGWTLLFYGDVLNLAYSILNGNIFSAVIGAVVGFYFLFQIRSYYK